MELSYETDLTEILDKLLEHHDIDSIKNALNRKGRKHAIKGNSYLNIATTVYSTMEMHSSTKTWAISETANRYNLKESTVNRHIEKFRKEFKEHFGDSDTNSFIDGYILFLHRVRPEIKQFPHLLPHEDCESILYSYLNPIHKT